MTIPLSVFARVTVPLSGAISPVSRLEQSGLAGAVGADDSDPVAALDAQREVADDLPFAIAFRHMLGVDHGLRAYVVLGQCELRRPCRAEHRGALRPHLVQLGQAPLVAASPRGHSALQPVQLELQLGVELLGRPRLFLVNAFGPGIEAAEADFGAPERAAVEPQAAAGQPGQEGAVVADRDKRSGEALEPVLEPFDGGQIEMIGRLVEQQQIGALGKRAGDRGAPPLAAAGSGDRPRQIDTELVGDRRGLMRFGRIRAMPHPIGERLEPGHRRVLLEQHDLRPWDDRALALVSLDHARETFEQGGLAGAVAADQRQPVARSDMDGQAAKQPAFALDQPEVFIGEDWRGHCRPLAQSADLRHSPT